MLLKRLARVAVQSLILTLSGTVKSQTGSGIQDLRDSVRLCDRWLRNSWPDIGIASLRAAKHLSRRHRS